MGLFSNFFGRGEAAQHPAPNTPAAKSATAPLGHYGRPMAPEEPVDWPVDAETGQVFDDEWLLRGVKAALNDNQYRAMVDARASSASLRRERLFQPGLDGHDERRELLRGRNWLEWGDHADQMKREERFESSLALVYEIIDVGERLDKDRNAPPGWYDRAAILLRKMKDYESEIRLMESVVKKYPGERFAKRLVKARELQEKAQREG